MTFITHEELVHEEVELLPARETLQYIHLNWAAVYAQNAAEAVNDTFLYGSAYARADQAIAVIQY